MAANNTLHCPHQTIKFNMFQLPSSSQLLRALFNSVHVAMWEAITPIIAFTKQSNLMFQLPSSYQLLRALFNSVYVAMWEAITPFIAFHKAIKLNMQIASNRIFLQPKVCLCTHTKTKFSFASQKKKVKNEFVTRVRHNNLKRSLIKVH